jgi:hypothetical protein
MEWRRGGWPEIISMPSRIQALSVLKVSGTSSTNAGIGVDTLRALSVGSPISRSAPCALGCRGVTGHPASVVPWQGVRAESEHATCALGADRAEVEPCRLTATCRRNAPLKRGSERTSHGHWRWNKWSPPCDFIDSATIRRYHSAQRDCRPCSSTARNCSPKKPSGFPDGCSATSLADSPTCPPWTPFGSPFESVHLRRKTWDGWVAV